MYKNILTPILLLSAFLMVSCDKAAQEHKSHTDSIPAVPQKDSAVNAMQKIDTPFEGIDVDYEKFTVDPKKGATIMNARGSKIIVPANAFVDKNGNVIDQDVEIQYREFREIDELMVSGIPMTYHHGGQKENFITAGMFELKGQTVTGEEINIAENKTIDVDMASTTASNATGVNFYYLKEETTEWEMLGASSRRGLFKNVVDKTQKEVEVKTNSIPVSKADKDAYKFELDLDYSKMGELKDYKDIIWQYVPTEGYDDPQTYENFNKEKWTSAKVLSLDQTKKLYIIELGSKTKTFKSVVTPVVGEKTYQKALQKAKSNGSSYRKRVEQVEAYNAQSAMVSMQIASVSEFGIYNHDIFYKSEQQVVTNLKFKLPKDQKMEFARVFLVMKDAKGLIEYTANGYDKLSQFTFNPKDHNGLVIVYPKNKVSVVYNKDFKNINFDQKVTEVDLSAASSVKNFETLRNIIQNI